MRVLRLAVVMIILLGLIYPSAMTGLGMMLFPHQAKGSLVYDKTGKAVGSKLIGQRFTKEQFFHGRPSSIQYDASASGSPNYGPSNQELMKRMEKEAQQWTKKIHGIKKQDIPLDLLTNSGSGLDPHISPSAALFQVPMVAKATGLSENTLVRLVQKHTEGRTMGVFGEPRVNVLLLNMDVQRLMEEHSTHNE